MEFEYDHMQVARSVLEVENIGQCALRATNGLGEDYYMVIRTSLGKSYIFTYGPIAPDLEGLPTRVSCLLERIDYNEAKLCKYIAH